MSSDTKALRWTLKRAWWRSSMMRLDSSMACSFLLGFDAGGSGHVADDRQLAPDDLVGLGRCAADALPAGRGDEALGEGGLGHDLANVGTDLFDDRLRRAGGGGEA